jgi:hypothetical protein
MPTIKQLHKIWKTQFQLFGGQGMPPQAYDGPTEGYGLTEQRFTDKPTNEEHPSEFTGNVVGEIKYDPVKKEVTVIPKTEE